MKATDTNEPAELIREAAEKMECDAQYVSWYSWPQVFGSTSGPRGGIGGQVMTTLQVYGFIGHDDALMYCGGVWRRWRDTSEQRFGR